MKYPFAFPHTISNPMGELITFHDIEEEDGVKKMTVYNQVQPGSGPPFHVHYKQEESLTVVKGVMGYQIDGQEEKILEAGETVIFHRGQMHRFWNAGSEILECKGWIKPANSLDYFLSGIYSSMSKAGKPEGDPFDSAFLMTRYKSEYDLKEIPAFVKKVIFPITVLIGKFLGKYGHFKDAPKPIK
ncbi:cupin domain-containing protein [Flavilitoribacter nigricans]|uniref:Cupin n=1 Tax=Flavilitoribacter nigricans (strain ATCC 23147 / DSM 23189 / NBRC 102662 / NCIMB 1420 / SS-2) TaxID=1122177 RepID=A0A2D0N720_FLAN2|nr:cupin domain-containing protein [Flavilitoribacter nigricans]PHN04311.1 cupin [Flavilitoribacter nigricans DSM 23189 = NBRC 102662]